MVIDRAELKEHLEEQSAILLEGSGRFDRGFTPAFKQLAVSIRVLVHDTRLSTSLLRHIGVKDRMQWLSCDRVGPALVGTAALSLLCVKQGDGATEYSYVAKSAADAKEMGTSRLVPFDQWWTEPVIRTGGMTPLLYSRGDLVRYVANKAGGAHVEAIPGPLRDLDRRNALGWTIATVDEQSVVDEVPLAFSPVPSTLRSIAEEVGLTIRNQRTVIDAALDAA